MTRKAIIFDFDGVIHDTFDFHRSKIKDFTGVELSEQAFKDIHNGNFYHSTPESLKDVNWEEYRDYIYHEMSNLEIKEEIRNTIFKLNKNHELFIISSGGIKNISDYCKNNQIISVFKEILGLELHRSKEYKFEYIFSKYNLIPDDCIFITDTLGDILEANKFDLKTIAVDFGFHDKETLNKGNPYKIISHLDELVKLINTK